MIDLYGIPNCDTVKKARAWLAERGIDYTFHDYKKEGADPVKLSKWVEAKGWETVLNRRGTTFRKLPDKDKQGIDALLESERIGRELLQAEHDLWNF